MFNNIRLNIRWQRLRVRLRRYYPRSILQIVLVGFCVVTLPLMIALVTATAYVGQMTSANGEAVRRSTSAVRNSRELIDELDDMQRDAGIYLILGHADLLRAYQARSADLRQTVKQLQIGANQPDNYSHLEALLSKAKTVSTALVGATQASGRVDAVMAKFKDMRQMGDDILNQNVQLIQNEIIDMQAKAQHAQHVLLLEALASLPVVALLCALVTLWIVRPLRSVRDSIRGLGGGDFNRPLKVHGPRDVQELGGRLEWLRNRLNQLENQQQTFLRHVSHELKTPLTSVREGADLLAEAVAGPLNAEQQEIADILKDNTLQLQKSIEGLLDFSMASNQHAIPRLTHVSMDSVVEEAVMEHGLNARAAGVEIETRLVPIRMEADREQMRSVVDNLLSNAIKYSPAGGTISVSLCKREGCAQLDIEDEGTGVAPEDRAHVFEAFHQGRSPPGGTGHIKGSGLGLSLAQQYVKFHEGDIYLVDNDRGAHFRVCIPLQTA